jgi:hypothetical protein
MLPRPTTHSKALGPGVAGPELAVATSAVLDRPPQPSAQQPLSGAQAFSVDPSLVESADGPRQHTQYPYVTGTSVLAVKYAGGVMLACDTLGAYGSTKRYKSLERIVRVNARTLVAAGGEVSDFQYISRLLGELATDDYRTDDGIELGPREVGGARSLFSGPCPISGGNEGGAARGWGRPGMQRGLWGTAAAPRAAPKPCCPGRLPQQPRGPSADRSPLQPPQTRANRCSPT